MSAGPRARLCTVRKWSDFQGYGFSLQASKGKPGHFLSDVDPQSPAYASGIRNNDFVVEVNGINVLSEPHIEVVNRIKQNPNEVSLLVVNDEARQYFESKQIIIDSHMKDLDKIFCPACNPKSAKAAKKTEPAKEKEAKKTPEEHKKDEKKTETKEQKREEGKKVEEKKPEEKKKVEEKKPEEKKTPEEKKPTEKPKSELAAKPDAKTNELFEIDMATVKVKCSNPRRKEKKPKSSFKQRQEEFNKL